jgi:hypothetical protein
MSVFAKINTLSSDECILEQKVTQYISDNSSIQPYCIKDIVILEADDTGIIDYCPLSTDTILKTNICFTKVLEFYSPEISNLILTFFEGKAQEPEETNIEG